MLELVITIANGVTLMAVALGAGQIRRAYTEFSPSKQLSNKGKQQPEGNLPSVTVCIPARNEDHALTDCLQSVLSSNYPKFEIIVLDDNSVDNTSVLIKSFAHAGVRFVAGSELPKGWLGKNYALQGLLDQASGSYVLFLDVDTRLSPNSIQDMVNYALSSEASMLSVMPKRSDGMRASVLFSTLRYFWELMFHGKLSPASAGNAWLVDRKKLNNYGELDSLKDVIKPESHLASYFSSKDRYKFLVSDSRLGVSYEKKWTSQLDTSSRLLFPIMGRQWSAAIIASISLLVTLVPLAVTLALHGFIHDAYWYTSLFVTIGASALYALYAKRVWRTGWVLWAFIWPVIVLQEILLIMTSFIKYTRGTVTWKGRPVRSED